MEEGAPPTSAPLRSILVVRVLHPHLAPLLLTAAGVVTQEGALLQHATTLAREFGLPAVVGVDGATCLIKPGGLLYIDGDTGLVVAPAQ